MVLTAAEPGPSGKPPIIASRFRWIYSVVVNDFDIQTTSKNIHGGRYSDIPRYSGIYIQILVGKPETSDISSIPAQLKPVYQESNRGYAVGVGTSIQHISYSS
jgi:hypothetical protein